MRAAVHRRRAAAHGHGDATHTGVMFRSVPAPGQGDVAVVTCGWAYVRVMVASPARGFRWERMLASCPTSSERRSTGSGCPSLGDRRSTAKGFPNRLRGPLGCIRGCTTAQKRLGAPAGERICAGQARWGRSGLNRRPTDYEASGTGWTARVAAEFVLSCWWLVYARRGRIRTSCATHAPRSRCLAANGGELVLAEIGLPLGCRGCLRCESPLREQFVSCSHVRLPGRLMCLRRGSGSQVDAALDDYGREPVVRAGFVLFSRFPEGPARARGWPEVHLLRTRSRRC